MEDHPNPIAAAIVAGVIGSLVEQAPDKAEWLRIDRRIQLFNGKAKGRVTLFLGSAISSLKPTHLPMWNQFVELIWLSLLEVGLQDEPTYNEHLFKEFKDFFGGVKANVPNYLITEVVSRRLGLQYLELLKAFEAQNVHDYSDKPWAINNAHQWAARSLMTDKVAAIVTTNFDNYLEKALEALDAILYQVSGDAHQDGREISARLRLVSSTRKLVLVVNGLKAFAFVRTLMPQLGAGKITFLFKLHGSCYDPPSCIDTRLQRSQGLPSYSTDILDILLVRSTLFVAGFSGSDMNDNLDYLRLISNRNHARVVWLEYPNAYREKSLNKLVKVLDLDPDCPNGLCLISGSFVGERVSANDETTRFAGKVQEWAGSLGRDWCKLVTIDLMMLFEAKTGQQSRSGLLPALNYGEIPRQDWNLLLGRMRLQEQQDQIAPAVICNEAKRLLENALIAGGLSSDALRTEFRNRANLCLQDLNRQHIMLEKAALVSNHPRSHAQTWVLSSLSGLILLCGGELGAAIKSLGISAGLAWVVGDFESYHLIRSTIAKIESEQESSRTTKLEIVPSSSVAEPCIAFAPAMDNVNTKSNKFGVPPAVYIRALLHRSILFADGLAIPANVITSSTVFVDEVLFQGEVDMLDEFLAQHLYPLLPDWLDDSSDSDKLSRYVESRHQSYIQEPVQSKHVQQLDQYFGKDRNSSRFLYYDEVSGSKKYGSLFRRQFDSDYAATTVKHLVQLWEHITPSGHWDVHHEDHTYSLAAREAAADVVEIFRVLQAKLPDRLYRSSLYRFADLFEATSDPEAFIGDLRPHLSDSEKLELISSRGRIVERPWLYGPYCHELFDMPYRCNMTFNQAALVSSHGLVFLEDDEVPSWQFISEIFKDTTDSIQLVVTPPSATAEHKCSSILLSQATKEVLMQARESLHHVRARFAGNLGLSKGNTLTIKQVISKFESRSLKLPEVIVECFVSSQPPALLKCMQDLLQRCIFLVRKGLPLDPMYEEAQLTVPGLHMLQRI